METVLPEIQLFLNPLLLGRALSAVQCSVIYINAHDGTQDTNPGRPTTVLSASLSVRWDAGCHSAAGAAAKQPNADVNSLRAWEIGGAGQACPIRVHCMSLTLTAGDLARGHVPDLGEFQVLLGTVSQLINLLHESVLCSRSEQKNNYNYNTIRLLPLI